jgi:hypothetical protein
MDRSGLSGGLSGTSSGGTKSGSGLKAPSGPEDDITKLVRELEELVKTKPVPHGAVASMDVGELSAYISQIVRVVAEMDAKIKKFNKLIGDRYEVDPFESAVRARLVTYNQTRDINECRNGIIHDLNSATIVLEALKALHTKEEAAKANPGPGKSAGVPSASIHKPSGLLWIGGGLGVNAKRIAKGDIIAGNHGGATTIEGDWTTDAFWTAVSSSGATHFAIDVGSESHLTDQVYPKLARLFISQKRVRPFVLHFEVPDTYIATGHVTPWVTRLIEAMTRIGTLPTQVYLNARKDLKGDFNVVVTVSSDPDVFGDRAYIQSNNHIITATWLQQEVGILRGTEHGDSGTYQRNGYSKKTYEEIVREYVSSSSTSSRQASSQVAQPLAAYTDRHASEYATSALASAEGKLAPTMHLPQAAADTKKVRAFKDNDEVTFKYNRCRLGGKVISYKDSKNTYKIEWIKKYPKRTKFHFESVSSTDVYTRKQPEFSNSARDQVFSDNSPIWFHRGHDSFQGKVKEYQVSKSDPEKQRYTYSIRYEDDDGDEKHEEQIDQIYLERR